jgi:tellurite methyltransferase
VGRGLDPILDARSRAAFLEGHAPGAAHLGFADWGLRAAELPPRDLAFEVVGEDADRSARYASLLNARGFADAHVANPKTQEDRAERGAARAVLWRPSPALERFANRLPVRGRALDIACGSGRHATWLAARGLAAWGVDLLPDALVRARALARAAHELDPSAPMRPRAALAFARADAKLPLPWRAAAFDVVCGFRYLDPALFPRVSEMLVPGGFLVWETFSVRAPEDAHPRRPEYRLADGELAALCTAAGLLVEAQDRSADGALDSVLARRTTG